MTGYRLQVTGDRGQVTGYREQVTDLQPATCNLSPATSPTGKRLIAADKVRYVFNALKSGKRRVSSSLRGKIFRRLICTLSFLSVLFAVFSSFCIYLPAYINSKWVPWLAEKLGQTDFSCEIRRISFSGLDAGGIEIGTGDQKALSVQSLQSDYSLAELYQRHIRRIRVSGAELYCRFKDGKLTIRGCDFSRFRSSPSPSVQSQGPSLPFSVGKFEIRNAVVICERDGESRFRIPLDLEIVPESSDMKRFVCTLKIYPRGEEIVFIARPDLNQKKINLNIAAAEFSPERFSDFLKPVPGILLTGQSDIKAGADISFDLSSEPGNFSLSVSSLSLNSPIPLRISDIRSTAKLTAKGIESSGTFNLRLEPAEAFGYSEAIESNGNFFGFIHTDTLPAFPYEFGITVLDNAVSKQKQCNIRMGSANLTSGIPAITIQGKGEKGTATLNYTVIVPNIRLSAEAVSLGIPSVSLKGTADIGDTRNSEATLQFSDADIKASKLNIQGIKGYLPLKFPGSGSGKKGSLSAKTLQWDSQNLGSIDSSIQQKESGLVFEGKLRSALLPGLVLAISGKTGNAVPSRPTSPAENNDTRIILEIPEYKTASDIDLGRFSAKAKGLTVNFTPGGGLRLKADLIFGNDKLKSRLDSELSHAVIHFKDKDIAVEDLSVGFSMPDIFAGHSAHSQKFSFKKASFGKIVLDDGKAEFQLEPDGSLLIEKSSFKWCKGNVHAQALRIFPGVSDYDLSLYCDRLNLAELMEQLGVASAEGDGAVNGRIPLEFRKGKIRFDEAFLFSTPGDGGTIHVTGAETLTAGIPQNTTQYAQIDLAKEALKNFDYQWARLKMVTEGEDLRLQLQFDGKPADPLPFVYKKELGSFIRVEAGSQGSRFQGIRLDVNMLLPLNKILKYKNMW